MNPGGFASIPHAADPNREQPRQAERARHGLLLRRRLRLNVREIAFSRVDPRRLQRIGERERRQDRGRPLVQHGQRLRPDRRDVRCKPQ